MPAIRFALQLLALVAFLSSSASAQAEPSQRELMQQAQSAELQSQPAEARRLYQLALERDASSRLARRIRARLSWIDQRSEGDFGPLAALMRVQRQRAPDVTTIDAFAAELERFPPGKVRRESLALVANAYLSRLSKPERALATYRAWRDSPDLSESERQLSEAGIALSQARLGDPNASLASLRRAQLEQRPEATLLRQIIISRIGMRASAVALLLFVAVGLLWGGWRGIEGVTLRRTLAPRQLLVAAYVLLLPLLMVWLYNWRLLPQFAWLVGACTLTLLLASVLGSGVRRSHASRFRIYGFAALSAVATAAAAFVALDHSRLLLDMMLAARTAP